MTDIVIRLRKAASVWHDQQHSKFMREAADEIEMLRTENWQLKRALWTARDEARTARGLPLEGEP